MADLRYKLRLDTIVWCFDTLETWLGCPEFRHTNSGVEWTDRMIVRARFTILDVLHIYIHIYTYVYIYIYIIISTHLRYIYIYII